MTKLARPIGSLLAAVVFLWGAFATQEPATPRRLRTALERLAEGRLEAVRQARQNFARERKELPQLGIYQDFRAVIHVHAEDSAHTKGTRPEVLEAAKRTGVRIIMWSDHSGPKPDSWHGFRDGVLFLRGGEEDGLMRFPAGPGDELRFLSHPEERLDASLGGFDGMEIYNLHAEYNDEDELVRHLRTAAASPEEWQRIASKVRNYPDEFFAAATGYPAQVIAKWDRETLSRRLTGIAANDAHQNQVYFGVAFDPYEVSFRHVSTHILARELNEEEIRRSLREGRAYVAHEWLCDPEGFFFAAVNNLGVFEIGDQVPLFGRTRITAQTPLKAHLKLFRNGAVVEQTTGSRLSSEIKEPGAYRLEAWLTVDGEERAWIYSNPIYVRPPAPDEMRLPSAQLSSDVNLTADLTYREGTPEEAPKLKLDVYRRKEVEKAPVLFFVHGGAWRTGDRSQYRALGNRFAREGFVVVIPSYRLAPKYPFPAQIEDTAAAFAWTVANVARYGGDPDRIYLGGHSAGGHLVTLLALDPRHLQLHGLSPRSVRGVVSLSGVYEIMGLEDVFGQDAEARRLASPLSHVRAGAPPMLVAYCQWDYLTLPQQARRFAAALREAGAAVELAYVPDRNHISEMARIVDEGDATARVVLQFLRRQP